MFGLGFLEIIVILILALLLFGPKKLPEIARKLGQAGREIKNSFNIFKDELDRPEEKLSKQESTRKPPQDLGS